MRFNLFMLIFFMSLWQMNLFTGDYLATTIHLSAQSSGQNRQLPLPNKPAPRSHWTDHYLNYVASVFDYFPMHSFGGFIDDESEFKDFCDRLHVNYQIIRDFVNQRYRNKAINRAVCNIYIKTQYYSYVRYFCVDAQSRRQFVETNKKINKYQAVFEDQHQWMLKIMNSIEYMAKEFGFQEGPKYTCCMWKQVAMNFLGLDIDDQMKREFFNRSATSVIKHVYETLCYGGEDYKIPKHDCQTADFNKLVMPNGVRVKSRPNSLMMAFIQMLGSF